MLNTPEPVRIRSYLERKKERERAQAEAAGHPWNENESLPASPASPLDPTSVFTKQITVSPPTCSSPAPDNLRDEIPTSRYYNPPQQHSSHQLNHRHSTSFSNMHLPAQKMPPVPSYSKPTGPAVSSRRPLPSPGPTAVGRRQSIDVLAKQGADNGLKGRKLSMPYMRESDFLEHMASPFAQQSSSSTNPLVSARPTRSQTVPLRLPAPLPPPTPATSERPLPALRKYRSSFMQSIPEPQESHSIPTYSPSSSSTFHSPVRPNMDHGPIWDPNTAQKHDTINSVKSLDRFGMIPHRTPPDMAWGSVGKRPLPRPPGVVGVSKSLDRGDPVTGHGSGFPNPSRVVTHHRSTGDFQGSTADVLISDVQLPVKGPSGPEIVQTVSISSVQVVTVPSIPTFALEGVSVDEENELAETNKAPSLVISDGPVISVTCSDADELPSISISVPTFNFPDEDDEPASVPLDAATPLVSDITPPVRFPDGRGIFCAKCDLVIIGRILNAMDRRWHPECFKCDTCTTSLEHVSSYEHEGRPYCHMDYHEVGLLTLSASRNIRALTSCPPMFPPCSNSPLDVIIATLPL